MATYIDRAKFTVLAKINKFRSGISIAQLTKARRSYENTKKSDRRYRLGAFMADRNSGTNFSDSVSRARLHMKKLPPAGVEGERNMPEQNKEEPVDEPNARADRNKILRAQT